MFKMQLPIEIFWFLRQIAKKNTVRAIHWGAATGSGVMHIRISEFTRQYKLKNGLTKKPKNILRKGVFTVEVAAELCHGLNNLLGDTMKNDVREFLKVEGDPFRRLILMALIKNEEKDADFLRKADEFCSMVFKVSDAK